MRRLFSNQTRLGAALEGWMGLGRKMILAAAFCGLAWSQTGLTTIQDTLFKADGTKFNGTLTIHWVTFDSTNNGTVVQQSTSVTVVNGNLLVQLVPNAAATPPANVYRVSYQSDGREQFIETWTVPVSVTPLKVSVVRTGTKAPGSGSGPVGNEAPIIESSVIGLVADLAQRPQKGPGYGTDRVALVNDGGQIETVVGDPGDCVFVDGTAGPCSQQVFADAETPGGIVDGVNNTLTLANPVQGSSLLLFRNGLFLTPSFDYTLNGTTVQFVTGATPQAGDKLTAAYRVDTGGSAGALTGPGGVLRTAVSQVLCSAAGTSTNSTTGLVSLGSCEIPASGLLPGDRLEVRFTFAHTGTASGFNLQVKWGSTVMLARSGGVHDSAVVGHGEAAVTESEVELSVESWGTVLPFLPAILTAPTQPGLKVDFRASMAQAGPDSIALSNFAVLRYPAN